ncbi:MAG TPA: hypothetical protein VG167_11310 [Verrucomicrobiae bacterium]|nr:hypothetical protein [Verrucomicrobiae bacterium]
MKISRFCVLLILLPPQMLVRPALGWDYEGHRVINQLALASLPTNFPAFIRTPEASERIAFLSGEPDRWRNVQDLALRHSNGPDHYLDLEQLATYGLTPEQLPVFRYDFVAELALARKAHPEKFPEIEAARNADHTRELVGFLPWAIVENYARIKSGFSYLKAYQENGGTPEEIANAQANIIYVMGVLGHYAGDASQPLHTTIHHHGWVGENPHQYTTSSSFHSWIDEGYFLKIGGLPLNDLQPKLRPAQLVSFNGHPAKPEEMFQAAMAFVIEQNKQVEPLYELEKAGKLSGEGANGLEGKPFLEAQMLKSGQLLGDLWLTAWQQAVPDHFLAGQLAHRHSGSK